MSRIRKAIVLATIICILITAFNTAVDFFIPLFISTKSKINLRDASSIGIIGGSDGPTAILVASSKNSKIISILFGLLSVIGVIYLFNTMKKVNR